MITSYLHNNVMSLPGMNDPSCTCFTVWWENRQ